MTRRPSRPFSFIRTLTVGFGIAPNLLTLLVKEKALAGLSLDRLLDVRRSPPVGTFTPP
jgi:hypothetical protein